MNMLDEKIKRTQDAIACWVDSWGIDGVYVATSGGKDSGVLLHITRAMYPDMRGMFNNTGLELKEIIAFVNTLGNIDIVRPKMPFHKVIDHYGWPVISKEQAQFISEWRNTKSDKLRSLRWNGRENGRSKISEKWKHVATDAPFKISHKCCDVLKKNPAKKYEKETGRHPILGVMASESQLRKQSASKHSCNLYDTKRPVSKPMMHWNESDIWEYIRRYNVPYCSAYDNGWERTGCLFCMYGIHKDNPNRFQMVKESDQKAYDYVINKLGAGAVLDFMEIKY